MATYFGIFRALMRTYIGIVESCDYILTNQTLYEAIRRSKYFSKTDWLIALSNKKHKIY